MKMLVINTGSSSIKYQLYQMPESKVLAKGVVERIAEESSKLTHYYDGKIHTVEAKVKTHEEGMELILNTLIVPTRFLQYLVIVENQCPEKVWNSS